jgi:hypothetical protein
MVFRQLNLVGKIQPDKINKVENVFFAVGGVISVLIVLLGLLGFPLIF